MTNDRLNWKFISISFSSESNTCLIRGNEQTLRVNKKGLRKEIEMNKMSRFCYYTKIKEKFFLTRMKNFNEKIRDFIK